MLGEKATDTVCDQFVVYMREVFQGDPGQSFRYGRPVTQLSDPHTQYILSYTMKPLIVAGTLGIATAILDAAALSFLGLGAQPPMAEWG